MQCLFKVLASLSVYLDNAAAESLSNMSNLLRLRGDHTGALAEAERALAITPNLALAHGVMGATLVFSGRPKEGLAALETSIRLDPRDPYLAARLNQMALGLYFCREYDAAIEAARGAIRSYPDHPLIYRWLAASLGQIGRID